MATKLSLAQLKSAAATYVDASKQAGTYSGTAETISGLLNKVGKEIIIPQEVNDKLEFLDADPMLGPAIIEETFIDFIQASTYDKDDNVENVTPDYPLFEAAAYSYPLGRKKFKTTVPYGHIEKAANPEFFGEVTSTIVNRMLQSEALYKYSEKKQLIANMVAKAGASANAANLVTTGTVPTDTNTGEAFLKDVQTKVNASKYANSLNIAGELAGAAPTSDLVLFVKPGILPSLNVDTLSGAFNETRMLPGVRIVELDDFGNDTKTYAVLVDTRGIKFHNNYNSVKTQLLADSDAQNYVKHVNYTGYISQYTYIHTWKEA